MSIPKRRLGLSLRKLRFEGTEFLEHLGTKSSIERPASRSHETCGELGRTWNYHQPEVACLQLVYLSSFQTLNNLRHFPAARGVGCLRIVRLCWVLSGDTPSSWAVGGGMVHTKYLAQWLSHNLRSGNLTILRASILERLHHFHQVSEHPARSWTGQCWVLST